MVKRGDRVFFDTMVIIEAHRTKCWTALTKAFRIETVRACLQESQHGRGTKNNYVEVPLDSFSGLTKVHEVSDLCRAESLLIPGLDGLDDGERDLLAFVRKDRTAWFVSSPDGASMRMLHQLGLLDRAVSLQELAWAVRLKPGFRENYTDKWLGEFRTRLRLGSF